MKNERDPWVRVKDESELREGMAVQLRNCTWCGRVDTFWLGEAKRPADFIVDPHGGGKPPGGSVSFYVIARTCPGFRWGSCHPHNAIIKGRLFRLADDQLADDAEPATVVRERETVK